MRSIRSLRRRAQTGLRRATAAHRRRLSRAWRDLSDLPEELARDISRRLGPLEPRPVEVPVRIRDR